MRVSRGTKGLGEQKEWVWGGKKGRERRFWTKLMEMRCEMHHRLEVALEGESGFLPRNQKPWRRSWGVPGWQSDGLACALDFMTEEGC